MLHDVVALDELNEGIGVVRVVEGLPVLLVRVGGRVLATSGLCSHEEQFLEGGALVGPTEWQCPHHGGALDLETGRPTRMPVCAPVEVFAVRIERGRVLLAID